MITLNLSTHNSGCFFIWNVGEIEGVSRYCGRVCKYCGCLRPQKALVKGVFQSSFGFVLEDRFLSIWV